MTALRQLLGGRRQVGVLLHVTSLQAGALGLGRSSGCSVEPHRVGCGRCCRWRPPMAPVRPTAPSGFALNPALLDQQDPLPPWTEQSTADYRQWCRQQRLVARPCALHGAARAL